MDGNKLKNDFCTVKIEMSSYSLNSFIVLYWRLFL